MKRRGFLAAIPGLFGVAAAAKSANVADVADVAAAPVQVTKVAAGKRRSDIYDYELEVTCAVDMIWYSAVPYVSEGMKDEWDEDGED